MYKFFIKRILDYISAFVLLILSSPLFVSIYILLRIYNKKAGAFFFQKRVGYKGKTFNMIKFKSMNEKKDLNGFLLPDAERLTWIGRFIRRTSLDELPQLINIIKGDMSLIGPRPLYIKYLGYYTKRENLRHSVLPGITGLAQVRGRNHVLWEERFEYDIYYAEHISFALDSKIFLLTIKKVIKREDIEAVPNLLDFDEYRRQQQNGVVFKSLEDALIK